MIGKALLVGLGNLLPAAHIGDVDPGSDHVAEVGTQVCQGLLNDLKAALGLGVGIARGKGAPLPIAGGGARDKDLLTHPHRPTIADLLFPMGARKCSLPCHHPAHD